MKTIIAGSRSIVSEYLFHDAVHRCAWPITEVVHGGCVWGVDALAHKWAGIRGLPLQVIPAEWGRHGKAAGPMRNALMVKEAQRLLAIWDGKSSGTRDAILKALEAGLEIHVIQFRDNQEDFEFEPKNK